MKDLVIIGGGGHCKSVIDVVESTGEYKIIGIIDSLISPGDTVLGYKVLGDDSLIPKLSEQGAYFHIAIGQIKSNEVRKKLHNILSERNSNIATIIAHTARVSPHAKIGEGTAIMHFAFINSSSEIGENCIINTGAIIEHDVQIGNNCHVSTSAKINGSCTVGENCFIGSNSVVNHNLSIGDNSIIGSASLVNRHLKGGRTYVGCPVK